MIELEEAQERIGAMVGLLPAETVPLLAARGRVLAGDIDSPGNLPPFDNSAMDGYAVRAEDTQGASPGAPAKLRLAGEIRAGSAADQSVSGGQCARIFTGAPLPRGADAVVMQEDTQTADPGETLVLEPVKPWENVRFMGEDVKRGAAVARRGETLTVGKLSLCAALGIGEARVTRLPRVGLLATGSELREPGQALAPGQIHESNRTTLALLLSGLGIAARLYPIVPDTLEDTRAALERGFSECDAIIASGGVSVGKFDFVKEAFASAGGKTDFWRVAIKPGKPFLFGRLGERFLFGLPGNPVSAFVTFLLLARPALLKMQGAADTALPRSAGRLGAPVRNPGNRRHFIRVALSQDGLVTPCGVQASHILSSLAQANGLLDLPAGAALEAGSQVRVMRWE